MSLFSSNEETYCSPFVLLNQTNRRRSQIEASRLEPENEYGNVEYKLKLTDPSPGRIDRLVTQLKWRIREGHGEAILFLGVKDNGQFVGLTQEELRLSLQTLERMSSKIGATMVIVKEKTIEPNYAEFDSDMQNIMLRPKVMHARNKSTQEQKFKENVDQKASGIEDTYKEVKSKNKKYSHCGKTVQKLSMRKVVQVLVRRKAHNISEELRVAVLGPTESGKSSLLGVLSHDEYDNGRGSARLNLFRHRHEITSGHTSSISQEIFGFDASGRALTYGNCMSTEEIIESSCKVVSLVDLAGHQRYLNTTLFGLGSHSPDLVLIVVNAISSLTNVVRDHLSLVNGMEKPVAIVINKVDLASKNEQDNCYDDLVEMLREILPSVVPVKVTSLDEAIIAGIRLGNFQTLPIFLTSCVSGFGLNLLYTFFNRISIRISTDTSNLIDGQSELQVDETFEVPGIGIVVSGLMVEGVIREGDEMLLGPDDLGNFSSVSIVSLQRHKTPCDLAKAGQKCTMAIKENNIKVRKGMVMKGMDPDWKKNFSICTQFRAKIRLINNARFKLSKGSQVSVYVGNVKQTCTVVDIEPIFENTFYFMELKLTKRPEYIREGSRTIIRHASAKGIGTICRVRRLFED